MRENLSSPLGDSHHVRLLRPRWRLWNLDPIARKLALGYTHTVAGEPGYDVARFTLFQSQRG
jgi:hypothetical protein